MQNTQAAKNVPERDGIRHPFPLWPIPQRQHKLKHEKDEVDPHHRLVKPMNDVDVPANHDTLRWEEVDDDAERQPQVGEREPRKDELGRVELCPSQHRSNERPSSIRTRACMWKKNSRMIL